MGELHAASGYQASVARLDSSRAVAVVANLVDWMTGASGVQGFEPRYRVLVGRPNASAPVGVAVARTLRGALRELARVDRMLATKSRDHAREELGLDF
jgi:hypothetical protein